MKKSKAFVCGLIAVAFVLAFAACEQPTAEQPTVTLISITAVYNGTAAIYPTTPLNDLKAGLTVMAQYSDNTVKTLGAADYSLGGTLTAGQSAVTVTYGGKTTFFNVTVQNDPSLLTLSGNITISPSSAVTGVELTAIYTGSEPVSFQWKKEGGNVGTNSNKYTPAEAGSYTVTVSAAGYNSKTSAAVNVTDTKPITTGLLFQLINNNTAYRVRRDPDAPVTSGEVFIPAYRLRPETEEYLPVMEIGSASDYTAANGAFSDTRITVIHIPQTVTVIGSYAFSTSAGGTSYLTTVNFEEGSRLVTIGNYAFNNCASLAGITIPEDVTSIGNYAFNGCTSLAGSITIPAGVTTISSNVFYGCASLAGIVIHDGVTSIGSNAFSGCSSLTGITIPAGVTSIGINAFTGCTSLTDIIIDNDKILSWGDIFPADNLSVTFRKNVGASAFYNSTRLASVTIAEGVTSIGIASFYNCASLASVTIGADVTTIGSSAFTGCTGITSIIIDTDKVTTSSGNTWGGTVFPAGTYSVTFMKNPGNYAFSSNNRALTSLTLAEGITSIGENAFTNCRILSGSITIPASVTAIGNSAFSLGSNYNDALSVTFAAGSQLQTIGDNAFSSRNELTSITIPASVKSIGNSAFYMHSTNNLTTVTFEEGSQLQSIGDRAFTNCTNLTAITIPAGVTTIGTGAFYNCQNLASITIPAGVTSFPNGTSSSSDFNRGMFELCRSLKTVTFADGSQLQSIGNNAFLGCTNLADITLPASVKSIGNSAFSECTSLTDITLPTGVTTIGDGAFSYSTNITSITIPASVTTVGLNVFSDWKNTQTINVPFANANARPSGWNINWKGSNVVIIKYWNGSTWV